MATPEIFRAPQAALTTDLFKAQFPGLDFVRLSPTLQNQANQLGPLADLLGTWVGTRGWNMIAVPFPANVPATGGMPFTLLVNPFVETITFSAIGAKVPNRHAGGIDHVTGLIYELRISDAVTNQPMHLENGMWLNTTDPTAPFEPDPAHSIARMAAIPHGDTLLALGNSSVWNGPPRIPDVQALPSDNNPIYVKQYVDKRTPAFDPQHPEQTLRNAIQGQNITKTTTLSLSTQPPGGILNIPFVTKFVNTTRFDCVFWIEEVAQPGGPPVMQLQYTQTIIIDFLGIHWPHINVNTLVKQ